MYVMQQAQVGKKLKLYGWLLKATLLSNINLMAWNLKNLP